MLINDSPFNITRYTDTYGNLIVKKRVNRQFQVFGSKIETGEKLVETNHVYIDGLYETGIQNILIDATYFKVDYDEGVIYFHQDKEGQFVNVNFYAKARVDWKALNVILIDSDNLYNETSVEGAFKEIATRVNNIVGNIGSSNTEIVDLRVDTSSVAHPTAKHRVDSDYNKLKGLIGDFEDNNITENSLAEAIHNNDTSLDIFNKSFSNGLVKYGLGTNIFGQEYLATFHNKVLSRTDMSVGIKVVASGDSTTQGVSVDSSYNITTLLSNMTMISFPNITYLNHGVSGADTNQWATNYVNNDITVNPDLIILRWGINDPTYDKSGNIIPDGTATSNRRDSNDFRNSLRGGLTAIRNQLPNVAIILMTPNSISDSINGRDQVWVESIIPSIKEAARDFQCCFINTYQLWQDSTGSLATQYLDSPWNDNRHIHPLNVFNTWITSLLMDVIYPSQLKFIKGTNNLINVSIQNQQVANNYPPNVYNFGISMHRTGSDFPWGNGSQSITFRSADGLALQLNQSTDTSSPLLKYRIGNNGLWGSWINLGNPPPTINFPVYQNGFTDQGVYISGRYYKDSSGLVHLSGLIKGNGTNVVMFILPAGYRPSATLRFDQRTNNGIADIDISSNGEVKLMTGDASSYVCLDKISFLAEQ